MRLRISNICRCRVLVVGAAASCLYFFVLEAIVSKHLDILDLADPQPRQRIGAKGDDAKKMMSFSFAPSSLSVSVTGGRIVGRRLSQRLLVSCSNMSYQNPPGPMTALVSFPGSGNTWIRYLLQQATGLYTGSIYKDHALLRHGFPAENVVNGSVLLVKTHEWGIKIRHNYSRAILLVREPLSAIMAEFNRQGGGHVGHASWDKYIAESGKLWKDFVRGKSRSWLELNLDWLKFDGPLHVIRYEHFTSNVDIELRRLLVFLNLNVSQQTMTCVLSNKEGIYKRKKKNLKFDPFDSKMRASIERYKQLFETVYKLYEHGFRSQMIDFIDSVLPTL